MSSDNSDNEIFTKEFLENIPEDSDSSDNEAFKYIKMVFGELIT